MAKLDLQTMKSEVLRLRRKMLASAPLWLFFEDPVEEYVYGKSGSTYHGFYNPSTVMDLVISNVQRGSRPLSMKPTNAKSEILKYGLNAQKLPIYITGFLYPDQEFGEFELITHLKDYSVGIAIDRITKKPTRIYEYEYESGRIKRIILCMFYDVYQDDELGNFFKIEIEDYEYRQNELLWTYHTMDCMLMNPRSINATITFDQEGLFKTITHGGVTSNIKKIRRVNDFHFCE
jgi:hypothetical protein